MGCRGRLKDLNLADALPKLFFNDNLTRANHELFWIAGSEGKEKQYENIWTKTAPISARKAKSSPVLRINFVEDIAKIVKTMDVSFSTVCNLTAFNRFLEKPKGANFICLHVNIRSLRKYWDYFLLIVLDLMFHFDAFIFAEANIPESMLSQYILKNYNNFFFFLVR